MRLIFVLCAVTIIFRCMCMGSCNFCIRLYLVMLRVFRAMDDAFRAGMCGAALRGSIHVNFPYALKSVLSQCCCHCEDKVPSSLRA